MLLDISSTMIETDLGPLQVGRTGSGAPALLWHSLFVDSATFAAVVGELSGEHELIIVDGPGHGGSPGPRRLYSLADCARAAVHVLDALGISTPVDWVGNAWGGHVGIVFADSFPARCRTLTTIGTPPYPLSRTERRQSALLVYLFRLLGPKPLSSIVVDALAGRGAAKQQPETAAAISESFRRGDKRGKYWAMQSVMLHRPDLRPALARLRVPTLVLAGRNDALLDLPEAERAAHSIPDGRFELVAGAGHVAPLFVAPGDVTGHILKFWAEAGGPAS
ncbi:alpha/beta hydrolase [Pseudarthrobacter phenanthrenivorans]|uniref:Alpha/beta hydrolase n=1 Tax=Pseudarthrobacter phenanthrenivorans TaxID=361575 RepID=A0A3B0G778_PSEPS|nr:alpha/beta hydrolase [Pseudarthrobacter phenanthrenivorans]RKO26097.1 alpha/beta hydrolase [Pseudarthrobacter phenanthrenivorans]